jgi:hypothetical protein
MELRRERGRNSVPSALPLTAGFHKNRFAGWLCVCLLVLQAWAVSCHVPGAAAEEEPGAGHAALASICSVSGSPVQPADGPQKKPARNTCVCILHTCGCCLAILTGDASLPPRAELTAARIGGFSGTGVTGKAILRNTRVRGPPAFLA